MIREPKGSTGRLRRLLVGTAATSALLAGTVAIAQSASTAAPDAKGLYIVQLADPPVVAYDGGVGGLKATAPAQGTKIDPYSTDVVAYARYLNGKHDTLLKQAGGQKVYDYVYSLNGFAAQLDGAGVAKLRATPGVVNVTKNAIQKIDTSSTPAFLGLSAPGGLWDQLGGVGNAGEGIVVGIIDSGIWPESPSFSDRDANGKLVFQQIPGYHGKCTPGEQFPASDCNQKLTTAQWFGAGFGGKAGVKATFPYEYWSARGAGAHGTHTASTAAGNNGVPATIDGIDLGKISGMAPRARVAAYKVCWGYDSDPAAGCATVDSVAAIDQATADGVDVMNFSISGSLASDLDPVEVAFYNAARAGIFVAASAGNSGPTASTVAHNSPWLTTVAAGSHDRQYVASVTLGNGATYTGAGLGAAVPSSPLILSTDAVAPGATATEARLCYSSADGILALDPAKVAGKIVVCDRGVTARVNKSLAVKEAGGVGMVLTNTSPNSLNADLHYVPTVHLQNTDRAAVWAYGATAGATASLSKGEIVPGAVAPDVASFSSRGPAIAGAGDLLKPDVMAPGVDVLAAMSPADGGRNFDFLSGTSMASPHIAGIGALMKQAHPDWSPAAIKSALMTTASQTRNNHTPIPGNPFGYGAGEVTPNSAVDPGVVFNSGAADWYGFLCGTGELTGGSCSTLKIDPSDLNYASIAIGSLAGVQTVKRTLTNVSGTAETYTASSTGFTGVNVAVSPASFTLAAGAKQTVSITFTRTTATLNAYAFGAVVFTGDKGHRANLETALKPVSLSAPAEVSGTGGSLSYRVAFGYDGPFTATARGLVAATVTAGTVSDDPTNSSCSLSSPNAVITDVAVPAGTTHARFQTFDADVVAGSDLDMCVFLNGALVGSSGGGTAAEQVNLSAPAPGTYQVVVQGWQTAGGNPTPFKLYTWLLDSAAAGNMTVTAPATATLGGTGSIGLSFSGLTAGTKYLGAVAYTGAPGMAPTIVRVDA